MQKLGQSIVYSASDLVGHLNCRYLTKLDAAVARGELAKPYSHDPQTELLRERGIRNEQEYISFLTASGVKITTIEGIGTDLAAIERTKAAMAAGDQVIAQAAFQSGGTSGRMDFLKRIAQPSSLGSWSYEVIDTKLAQETKGGTILQLCLYSDLLMDAQGRSPVKAYVVTPFTDFEEKAYRLDNYRAYYRQVRRSLEADLAAAADDTLYPRPIPHCEVCRWGEACDKRRRADDHLSLVAGVSQVQAEELERRGIHTLAALATTPCPIAWKPARGATQSYNRVWEQACIQLEGRLAGKILYELLPIEPGFGLAALPAPSVGDVFFDLEGDPFVGSCGREFLFGYAWAGQNNVTEYVAEWALTPEQEKGAFERFVDFVVERAAAHPDMHIFHYAPYEPAALKRLMGRYGSREDQVDTLLRSLRFVDLYMVVKGAIRASVESYSIKKLEPLYGLVRETPLKDSNRSLARVNATLEMDEHPTVDDADRACVTGYNRDDCISAWCLRDWLEARRRDIEVIGRVVPRPNKETTAKSEKLTDWDRKIATLMEQLMRDLPPAVEQRDHEQQAQWLLAHLLDWYRRENKAVWWEYFRLSDLGAEDLLDEKAAVSGLEFKQVNGGTPRALIHRYNFPPQETDVRSGDTLKQIGGDPYGSVEAISVDECWIDIKKRQDTADAHAESVFAHKVIGAEKQAAALVRLAGHEVKLGTETGYEAALRLTPYLEGGILPIQGPPGAGKTHTAAVMICKLAAAGKTIGVPANSHEVIRNLLDAGIKEAGRQGLDIICIQKPKEKEPDQPKLKFAKNNADFYAALGTPAQVGGGTAWLWSPAAAGRCVDVLFVDEAAQMALANVLAVSQCASTVVLLGDPQQLEQPIKGSHPEGTDVSGLHHLLGGRHTVPDDCGLFLAETWRLHPAICAFTSEQFYDGRLKPRPGLEKQRVNANEALSGAGLRYVPVPTQGNKNVSREEAQEVQRLVGTLLDDKNSNWVDSDGKSHSLRLEDILVVAPYNAQVAELKRTLPDGTRIGTVDKF